MRYFKKIDGDRIYLSPMNVEDLETYTKWINDPAVTDNIGLTRQQIGLVKEKELLENMCRNDYHFAIIRKEDETLLGNTSIFDINHIDRCAEVGIFIGEDENRGKGYGGLALRMIIKYGFETLNLNNILLKVFAFNKNAIACYEKIGFKKIGERRSSYFVRGEYHNLVFMDILPGDFYK